MKKILIAIAAIMISLSAYADNKRHNHHKHYTEEPIVNNYYETTNNSGDDYTYNTVEDLSVISMAMAQHQFNYGTYAYQKSVSGAVTENSEAFSAALAHRDCAKCGLFSASVGVANINNQFKFGIGVGYTWSH